MDDAQALMPTSRFVSRKSIPATLPLNVSRELPQESAPSRPSVKAAPRVLGMLDSTTQHAAQRPATA
jgi:hypothetical protein